MAASRLPSPPCSPLFAAGVCSAPVTAQESLKIGVLTIRSGPATPVGDDIIAGIETATRMYGPVLGRPVELIVEESQWNAQQAVTKATKLVQQNRVVAILGTSTVEALALLPVADRLGVPIVTSNSGSRGAHPPELQQMGVPDQRGGPDVRGGPQVPARPEPEARSARSGSRWDTTTHSAGSSLARSRG